MNSHESNNKVDPQSSWVRLPGAKTAFAKKESLSILEELGLKTADDFFSVKGEPLSKPGLGKRYRAKLSLPKKNLSLYLKRYEGEKVGAFISRWYEDGERRSPADREVNVAAQLAAQGIPSVTPLAYGFVGKHGANQKSFVVTASVPGESLENFFCDKKFGLNQKREIIRATALLARKFHENGWRHRDFYLCHIFMDAHEGKINLTLIDLARVFRPRWRKQRWQIKDLAQLNYSALSKDFSRTDKIRFAKIYFGCRKLDRFHKQLLWKVVAKTESIARHDGKKNR